MNAKPQAKKFELAAAQRVFRADPTNSRATWIIRKDWPVYLASAQDGYQGITQESFNSIGLISYKPAEEWEMAATAWPIGMTDSGTIFATAGHVLQLVLPSHAVLRAADLTTVSLCECRITFPDGGIYEINWICAAPLDLALFHVDIKIAPLALQSGGLTTENLLVAGYPLLQDITLFKDIDPNYIGQQFLSPGLVSPAPGGSDMLEHNASTVSGYSGGPVFDPATGQVVALHVWGSTEVGDLNDAVPIDRILQIDWLKGVIDGKSSAIPNTAECMYFQGIRDPTESAQGNLHLAEMMAPQIQIKRRRPSSGPTPATVAIRDQPDLRDHRYRPGFVHAAPRIIPTAGPVGDQMDEGSCAAFAVAAAIENQLARAPGYQPGPKMAASPRMLDRMARPYDQWLDDSADGTSLRAVLRGFYDNGVCSEAQCPFLPRSAAFFLTRERAKDARKRTLGGYARVGKSVSDMRMAVQEAGSVICTARIHPGWRKPPKGIIRYDSGRPPKPATMVVHAFVVDGYDADGFIVQSSWGPGWGSYKPDGTALPGHALWSFDDWSDNILDAWVIRLAPSSEKAFAASAAPETGLGPRRMTLLGHIARSESTGLVEDGTLSLGQQGLAETAAYLGGADSKDYRHLLLILPDPLWGEAEIARLALHATLRLKARHVYPFHVAHGLDDMLACRLRLVHDAEKIAARYLREGRSRDRLFERLAAPVLRAQIDSYAHGLRRAMRQGLGDALSVLPLFASEPEREPPRPLSILSFGLGGIAAEALLRHPAFATAAQRHLCVAPVRSRPKASTVWHLDEADRDESDLPGYEGCWGDLAAAALQYDGFRGRTGLHAPRPQALIEGRGFVDRVIAWLDHAPPTGEAPKGSRRRRSPAPAP